MKHLFCSFLSLLRLETIAKVFILGILLVQLIPILRIHYTPSGQYSILIVEKQSDSN